MATANKKTNGRHPSQHRVTKRICPGCGEEHEYPVRNTFHSQECAAAARNRAAGKSGESHERTGDTWVITLSGTDINNPEELLKYCKVDMNVWEIERSLVNKWPLIAESRVRVVCHVPIFSARPYTSIVMRARRRPKFRRILSNSRRASAAPLFQDTLHHGSGWLFA